MKVRRASGYHIRLDAEFFTLRRDYDPIVASVAVSAAAAEMVGEAEEDYRAIGEAAS
jgi:hypothetical protein